MGRGAWRATVHGVARVGHDLAAKVTTTTKVYKTHVHPGMTQGSPWSQGPRILGASPGVTPGGRGEWNLCILCISALTQWAWLLHTMAAPIMLREGTDDKQVCSYR